MRGTSEVRALFREHVGLSIRSFEGRKRVSGFHDETWTGFFGELLETFEARGWLDAHCLTAGTSTLGISFGYRLGKGFQWILTSFNPDFAELRPGHLLIDALVKEAIQLGDPFFDMFYGGEQLYKRQWCTEQIPLRRITIHRDKTVTKLLYLAEERFITGGVKRSRMLKKTEQVLRRVPTLVSAERRTNRNSGRG
jgi:CelD/BcsL family acetyltransferase involved in cellulose biosynthesis